MTEKHPLLERAHEARSRRVAIDSATLEAESSMSERRATFGEEVSRISGDLICRSEPVPWSNGLESSITQSPPARSRRSFSKTLSSNVCVRDSTAASGRQDLPLHQDHHR